MDSVVELSPEVLRITVLANLKEEDQRGMRRRCQRLQEILTRIANLKREAQRLAEQLDDDEKRIDCLDAEIAALTLSRMHA